MAEERAMHGAEVTLADASSGPTREDGAPDRGASIGRYVVLDRLGSGGMGVVYSAYDPELDRKVALKLLHPSRRTAKARARLQREAQALAKLSHPNVVGVHDVGMLDERVWIAMEFIEGRTLDDWSTDTQAAWPEIVAVLRAAGSGLAAAHEKGLIHRDFKPDNVMVGDDGRVVVMDFGVARAHEDPSSSAIGLEVEDLAPREALRTRLTQHGRAVGTPAYMAPEQYEDDAVGPAADQFAFCVTAWKLLYGELPFDGVTPAERTVAILEQRLRTPPAARRVPAFVHAALVRGLAFEPIQRWPSMPALLSELSRDPARQRRRVLAVGAGAALVATLGIVWAWREPVPAPCEGAADQLVDVWDPPTRAAVRDAFASTGLGYAPGVFERLAPELDAYREAWITMHTDACEATNVRHEQSEAALDLRVACLHGARRALAATAHQLRRADETTIARAHRLVEALPPVERCADLEALRSDVPRPPPEREAEVDELRTAIAEADATYKSGHYVEAVELLDELAPRVDALDFGPVRTELALERGSVRSLTGDYDGAEEDLRAALRDGLAWAQWAQAQEAASQLIFVVGELGERPDEGLAFAETARGLLERLPDDPNAAANLHSNIGRVRDAQGRYEDAIGEYRAALAIERDTEHGTITGALYNNLSNALVAAGRYEEAERTLRKSIELDEARLGPDHPVVLLTRNNLATAIRREGRVDEALAINEEVLATRRRTLPPGHLDIGQSQHNLGNVLLDLRRYDDAEAAFSAALEIYRTALGPDHPKTAYIRSGLATVYMHEGDAGAAESEFREVLRILVAVHGADHPNAATAHANLAALLLNEQRLDDARVEAGAAVDNAASALGDDHPVTAQYRELLGRVLLARGEADEAREQLEAAYAVLGVPGGAPGLRAATAFVLARALKETGGPAARVAELADVARQSYLEAEDPERAAEVDAFLKRAKR